MSILKLLYSTLSLTFPTKSELIILKCRKFNGEIHTLLVLQVKSSQVAFSKTSDNRTNVTIDINENKKH